MRASPIWADATGPTGRSKSVYHREGCSLL
jgi:hypothetical protein